MKWYACPICHNRLLKVEDDFIAKGVYIKCKKCNHFFIAGCFSWHRHGMAMGASKYDYVTVDSNGEAPANYIGNDSNIYNGTSESKKKE